MRKKIYFLNFNQETALGKSTKSFFQTLVLYFQKIDVLDLPSILNGRKETIVCLNNSLASNENLKKLKKGFLKLGVIGKQINFIELSSFPSQDGILNQMNNFYFVSLPLSTHELFIKLSKILNSIPDTENLWSGGRRGRVTLQL